MTKFVISFPLDNNLEMDMSSFTHSFFLSFFVHLDLFDVWSHESGLKPPGANFSSEKMFLDWFLRLRGAEAWSYTIVYKVTRPWAVCERHRKNGKTKT